MLACMTFKLIFFKNVLCQDLFIIFLVFTIQGTQEETLGAVWTMFAVRNLNPMSKRTVPSFQFLSPPFTL